MLGECLIKTNYFNISIDIKMKICDLNTILEKQIEYDFPYIFIDTVRNDEIFIDSPKVVLKIDTEMFLNDAFSSFLNKPEPHTEITKQFLLDKDRTQHFLIYKNAVYSFKLLPNITNKILQGIHTQSIIVPLLEIAHKYVKLKYSDSDIVISQCKKGLQYYHYVDNPNVKELFEYKHDIVITINMNICKSTKCINKCKLKIKIPYIATIDECIVFDEKTKFTIEFGREDG